VKKVAVLITGYPRFQESTISWWQERAFDFEVDYYIHLWGDSQDATETQELWRPSSLVYHNQNQYIAEFAETIQNCNSKLPAYMWDYLPKRQQERIAFRSGVAQDSINFWGQYLSVHEASQLVNYDEYDYVIKCRSDLIIDDQYDWQQCFAKIDQSPDDIFVPWIKLNRATPFVGDLVIVAASGAWKKYTADMKQNAVNLATVDRASFYDMKISGYENDSHLMWVKLALYTQQSINTMQPFIQPVIIRKTTDLTDKTFAELREDFLQTGHAIRFGAGRLK
jgi:hypothetical protein